MKTLNDPKRPGVEGLKEEFVRHVSVRAKNTSMSRETVRNLVDQDVSRRTLVSWAVYAGYSKGYVSSLLSQILCSMGPKSKPGRGEPQTFAGCFGTPCVLAQAVRREVSPCVGGRLADRKGPVSQ